jgi:hypothetical protein
MTPERAAAACGTTVKSVEEWLAGVGPRMEPAMRAAIEKEAGLLTKAEPTERDPLVDDVLAHVERELVSLMTDANIDRRAGVFQHFKNQVSYFADYARDVARATHPAAREERPPGEVGRSGRR